MFFYQYRKSKSAEKKRRDVRLGRLWAAPRGLKVSSGDASVPIELDVGPFDRSDNRGSAGNEIVWDLGQRGPGRGKGDVEHPSVCRYFSYVINLHANRVFAFEVLPAHPSPIHTYPPHFP